MAFSFGASVVAPDIAPHRSGPKVGHKARALWNIGSLLGAVLLIYGCMRVCSTYHISAEARLALLTGVLVVYAAMVGFAVRVRARKTRRDATPGPTRWGKANDA